MSILARPSRSALRRQVSMIRKLQVRLLSCFTVRRKMVARSLAFLELPVSLLCSRCWALQSSNCRP